MGFGFLVQLGLLVLYVQWLDDETNEWDTDYQQVYIMKKVVWFTLLCWMGFLSPLRSDETDIAALLISLKDEQTFVRASAALALGNRGPAAETAVPVLIQTLADRDGVVRARAAEALALIQRKPDVVVPALVQLTASPEVSDRI